MGLSESHLILVRWILSQSQYEFILLTLIMNLDTQSSEEVRGP